MIIVTPLYNPENSSDFDLNEMTFGGINELYIFFPLVLLRYANSGGYKNKTNWLNDNCRITIIVKSASTAAPIGLLPKMAKF
jgi:hypothetical protein